MARGLRGGGELRTLKDWGSTEIGAKPDLVSPNSTNQGTPNTGAGAQPGGSPPRPQERKKEREREREREKKKRERDRETETETEREQDPGQALVPFLRGEGRGE